MMYSNSAVGKFNLLITFYLRMYMLCNIKIISKLFGRFKNFTYLCIIVKQLKFKGMKIESTNDNTHTATAITYSECYAQPFLLFNESNLDTMKRMPDNFIDLTVTSPPYDNLRKYKGYSFPFEEIAKELYRVTKKGGIVVWVVGDATMNGSESGTSFKQALYFMSIGFNLHDTMIYRKLNPIPLTHNRYEQAFEDMFVLSKGKPNTFNPIKIPCKTAGKIYNIKRPKAISESSKRDRDEIMTTNNTQ